MRRLNDQVSCPEHLQERPRPAGINRDGDVMSGRDGHG
jgi:hypothetical protein